MVMKERSAPEVGTIEGPTGESAHPRAPETAWAANETTAHVAATEPTDVATTESANMATAKAATGVSTAKTAATMAAATLGPERHGQEKQQRRNWGQATHTAIV